MGKKPAQHPGYEEMKDTPWITQGRDIAQRGGEGILENYNRVNVFDEGQRTSMEKLNEDAYRRAFDELNRGYREGMNKYASANYNRFGSLNATPSSYISDEFNRQYSRDMSNLAYNKAINYENLVNQELQRRYNTLNMYNQMYDRGAVPYELDLSNWDIRNKNRDIQYQNAIKNKQAKLGGWASAVGLLMGAPLYNALGIDTQSYIDSMFGVPTDNAGNYGYASARKKAGDANSGKLLQMIGGLFGVNVPQSTTTSQVLGNMGSSGAMSTYEPVDVLDDYLHGDILYNYGSLGGQVGG